MRWGMVIDLKKCVGCYSCTVSCKEEHFLPPGIFWNRVLIAHKGKYPVVTKEILPVLCNHCKEAACVEVCPTGASHKREDGIVLVDSDMCVGCKACIVACPYQHRSFFKSYMPYFKDSGYTPPEELGMRLQPLPEGTAVKCTFCVEKIEDGMSKGLMPGDAFEATPACVTACPTNARVFGDIDDPESEVSNLIRARKGVPFHPEFETEPSVFYIE